MRIISELLVAGLLLSASGCVFSDTSDNAISTLLSPVAQPHSGQQNPPAASDTTLHFVSTTDLHGYLLAQNTPAGLTYGGVDVMAGYFNIAKSADLETVFVDSGDLFQGTIISNTSLGKTVIEWMNYVGYTAAAVGNHDFDFGPGDGHDVVLQPGEDPLGALKSREGEAQFKFLSANICSVDEDKGKCADVATFTPASFVQPYLIQKVHGLNVGIIGLTTTSTPDTTMPSNVSKLRFLSMSGALERYLPEVKSKGADLVVVITHEGGFCAGNKCNSSDPIFQFIDELKPETRAQLPVVFAGHTHNAVNTLYNGVRVMISRNYGQTFGYTTLTYHAADHSVSVDDTKLVDFCTSVFTDTGGCYKGTGSPVPAKFLGQAIQPDAKAVALIQNDIDLANAVASRVVGKLVTPLVKGSDQESELGDFMSDAYRACLDPSCSSLVDIAFQNNGGIRTNQIPAGDVTYGEVFQLYPFDDVHAELAMTGGQVHDLLTAWFSYNSQKFSQVSGIQMHYSLMGMKNRVITNAVGETETLPDPITLITFSDGAAFDETKTYRVVMADFLATGGGGTAFVLKGMKPTMHYERKQRDEIVDFFKSNPAGFDYSKMPARLIQSR